MAHIVPTDHLAQHQAGEDQPHRLGLEACERDSRGREAGQQQRGEEQQRGQFGGHRQGRPEEGDQHRQQADANQRRRPDQEGDREDRRENQRNRPADVFGLGLLHHSPRTQ